MKISKVIYTLSLLERKIKNIESKLEKNILFKVLKINYIKFNFKFFETLLQHFE
jgi:hypothetical protein